MSNYCDLKNMLLEMTSKEGVQCRELGIGVLMQLFAYRKYIDFVELLIMRNVDINVVDKEGRNILIYLLIIGGYEIKKYDLHINDENYDMYLEIERVCLSREMMLAVEMLLNRGIMINKEDKKGNVALDYAFDIGFTNLIKLLLERGAKISKASQKYINARFLEEIFEDKLFFDLVLKQDIDLNVQDDRGRTILMFATDKDDVNLVKYLIKKGADVNMWDYYGDTALMIACEGGYFDIVGILLNEHANINCKDLNESTALMYACCRKHIGVVKLLLKENVDLDIRDKKGYTALMIAASNEDEEIVELLIDKGATIDIKNNGGFTLLNDVCRKKSVDVLKVIISKTDKNSDINMVARLALGYINYEKTNSIKELKDVIATIPYERKFKIYEQFFKEMEDKFDVLFEQKTLKYKTLMRADATFFNTLNTIKQILNKEKNIGNSLEKLYLVMLGFCGMIKRYYTSSNIFAKKFIQAVKNSADNMMRGNEEKEHILSIEKTLSKIKKGELLFLLTKTKAGNIHNIPEIVFKIEQGPLKGRYALLLVNFGYGFDLNDLGASQVSMYIFSMDTQTELKKIAKRIFDVSNDFGNVSGSPSKVREFYEKVHELFFRESKRITKSAYNINEMKDLQDLDEFYYDDISGLCAKVNKNLGIALRFDNNMPRNVNNCFIKQQQKALEVTFSILKTCYDNRNHTDFDIVSFMRINSLDCNKTLIYTHLSGLFTCDIGQKKEKGINTKKFKKELSEEILKVVVKGYEVKNKGIRKITKQEALSIQRELFVKNQSEIKFVK